MAYKIPPRVKMTISAGGTGNLTLGVAVASFQSAGSAGIVNSDTFPYYVEEGNNAECGIGTYISSGTSFSRSIIWSTNSNSPVNFTTAALFSISPSPEDLSASQLSGIIKGDGAGNLDAATAGTDYLAPGSGGTITKGFTLTPNSIGTKSTGWTVDPTLGNYQYFTNGGAHTITAPSSDCAVDILCINGASSGALAFSGFKTPGTGANGLPYATTNNTWWVLSIRRINGVATYSWDGPWT